MLGFRKEGLVREYANINTGWFSLRLEDLHPVSAPYSALSQPIPMDMSGDLKIDLFGTLPTTSPDSRFKVWRNVWNEVCLSKR